MKKLSTLLLATAMSVAAIYAQSLDGSNCGQAIEIPTIPDSCAVNDHQLNAGDHERWHHIKPDQPDVVIRVKPPQAGVEAHVHKLELAKGGCGGLQTIETKNIASGDELVIARTDMAVNEDYFIKLERDPNCTQCNAQQQAFYGLCVERQSSPNSFFNLITIEGCGLDYVQVTQKLNARAGGSTVAVPNPGNASFSFSSIPANAQILRAYIWFTAIMETSFASNPTISCTFSSPIGNYNLNVSPIALPGGVSNPNPFTNGICWGSGYGTGLNQTGSYFADITSMVPITSANATYTFSITNNNSNSYDLNGATMMLVYDEPCATTTKLPAKLAIWHGLDLVHGSPAHLVDYSTSQMGGGFSAYTNNINSKVFMIVADIETNSTRYAMNKTLTITPPTNFNYVQGNFYNFIQENTNFANTQSIIHYLYLTNGSDCFAPTVFGAYTQNGNVTCQSTNALIANAGNDVLCNHSSSVTIGGSPTATGGVSPYNYLWSPATGLNSTTIANPTVSSSSAMNTTITYTVTVTDSKGCISVDNVIVSFSNLTANAGPDKTVCIGASVSIGATPVAAGGSSPYTYLWSPGNITGSNPTVSPSVAATYTVTVTDANGCTATDQVTVTVNSTPAPAFSGNQNSCTNPATYTISNPVSGTTYNWTITNGSPATAAGTSVNVTWNIPANGTGVVSVTATNAGCVSQPAILIVYPCCDALPPPVTANQNIYLNNTSSASGTTTYSGKNIQINGIYTVSANSTVIFENSLVSMGPNARIEIGNNATLICTTTVSSANGLGTTLKAGCGYMWDGIYLTASTSKAYFISTAQYTYTVVMDAKNAVVTQNGGNYRIIQSVFANNLKSVVQQNDAGTEIIKASRFLSDATILPYYTGSTVSTPQRSVLHIELNNVTNIIIGTTGSNNQNQFSYAEYGISALNSNVNLKNNKFENFTALTSAFLEGSAVVSVSTIGTSLTAGGNNASKNYFNNCAFGISGLFAQNMNIANNDFGNVETGVLTFFWFLNGSSAVDISSNIFSNYNYGILCYEMQNCTLKVNGNTLTQSATGTFSTGTGISVQNTSINSAALTPEIKNNIIGGSVGSYKGIHVVKMRNGVIKNNTLTLPHSNTTIMSSPNIYGILAQGCSGVQISNNTVQRTAANVPNTGVAQKLYGISIENSAGTKVAVNNVIRMGSGIHATGACTNSKLYCNTLDKCWNGFFLENASIGNQGVASGGGKPGAQGLTSDNVWTDLSGQANSRRILYQNLPASFNWYYKNSPSSYNPTSGLGFLNAGGINTISFQTSSGLTGCALLLKSPDAEEREEKFGPIVRDEKIFSNHEPEFKHWEKEIAYKALKEDDWHPLNASDDALFQNFMDITETTNIGKFREVRMAMEQNDLVLAESKNDNITPTHLIEENRKTVNAVYLNMAKTERIEPDAAETAILESIACQDPLESGDAVYSARVILRRNDMCMPSAKMEWNEEEKEEIKSEQMLNSRNSKIGDIYPNPNNGKMQLRYAIEKDDYVILNIYDITGKLLFTKQLLSENSSMEIDNFAFKSGVYYYSIALNETTILNKKLVVIK